jgi:hypothetical protein
MTAAENDIFWVISNYQQDPSAVVEALCGEYQISNQGEPDFISPEVIHGGRLVDTLHSGHNLSDYLQYIIENYDRLPGRIGFVKGNLFPRHISKEIFLERKKCSGFVSLYGDEKTFSPQYKFHIPLFYIGQQVAPGSYLEIANNWYAKQRNPGHYYPKLNDLFQAIFKRSAPKYVLFTPGACMIVPKENIIRWPLELYRHLYEVVTYKFFPVEAFHLERIMLYLFQHPKI